MTSLLKEISSLSRLEKLFIPFVMLICWCIGLEYSITRPASQSIFLGVFSAEFFPAIWLATMPLNLLIVTLYNRYLSRLGPLKMMGACIGAIALINLSTYFILPSFPEFIFFHFCWKDIYILLMFKQLWSMIHSTIPSRGKTLYGIIFGCGTVGATLGSLFASKAVSSLGSETLFLFTAPIYALLFFSYTRAYRFSKAGEVTFAAAEKPQAKEGFSMILKNRYLLTVLALVVFMQVSVALIDYQFSHQMEIAFPEKDLRTAAYAKAIGLINCISLGLQFIGSFLLMNWLGLKKSHFLIPLILLTVSTGQWLMPGMAMITCAFVLTKAIDFSLFGVLREMLFIPLKIDEKFRAKAVIDVFAYRTSKALASFLLLGLQLLVGSAVFSVANALSIVLFCTWLALLAVLFKFHDPTRAIVQQGNGFQ